MTPPYSGIEAPHTPLRPPAAVNGILLSLQYDKTCETCSVDVGRTIAAARTGTSPTIAQCMLSGHQSRLANAVSKLVIDFFPEFKTSVADFVYQWSQHPGDTQFLTETNGFIQNQMEMRLNIPTVGASGAVFGILLAFGMLFPNTMIYLYFFFPLKAKYFVMLYGAFELYSGVANQAGDNVAHFAHLGGMLFGFILIKYWQNNKFKNKFQ
jgi:hypothetical protein